MPQDAATRLSVYIISFPVADRPHLAISFAQIKDRERTLEWLEKALAERSPDLPSRGAEPPMDFVREDPRFKAVFRKVFERS
jgi:hypothetical protein